MLTLRSVFHFCCADVVVSLPLLLSLQTIQALDAPFLRAIRAQKLLHQSLGLLSCIACNQLSAGLINRSEREREKAKDQFFLLEVQERLPILCAWRVVPPACPSFMKLSPTTKSLSEMNLSQNIIPLRTKSLSEHHPSKLIPLRNKSLSGPNLSQNIIPPN